MFSKFTSRLAAAAFAVCAGTAAAHASGPVYVNQASSPVFWGANGDHAVMLLRYDNSAKIPLMVSNINVVDLNGANIIVGLYNCGTPVKQGDTFVGFSVMPGQNCYLRAQRTGASVAGRVTLTDSTGAARNIDTFVRTMLEILRRQRKRLDARRSPLIPHATSNTQKGKNSTMFNTATRGLMMAALAAAAVLCTQVADAAQVQQTSSATFWGQAGDHADLVLHYDGAAQVTLSVLVPLVIDAGGNGVSQQLMSCGTPVKTGDTVTSYSLSPGQYRFLRAYRSPNEIVGKFIVRDNTPNASNIVSFARSSLEVRDVSENVLTHVEVR